VICSCALETVCADQLATGRGFQLSFETPKSESLNLFHLGERTYDHIIFFPIKTKGNSSPSDHSFSM
jgi:hypothetical protein